MAGGEGNDTLEGGDGNDQLYGYFGRNVVYGGDGNDYLRVDSSFYWDDTTDSQQFYGGAGDDLIQGSYGKDTLSGGDGQDFISSYAGLDQLAGDAGNDVINRQNFGGKVTGGSGNDTLSLFVSDDVAVATLLDGGDGLDRLVISNESDLGVSDFAMTIDLAQISVSQGLVTVQGFESMNVSTGSGNDYLSGGNKNDTIASGGGYDTLHGMGGNDFLSLGYADGSYETVAYGGTGNDTLWAGDGGDSFVFDSALIATNADIVEIFDPSADMIVLDSTIFTGLSAGNLKTSAFVKAGSAQDADDRIIYNELTDELSYDADGAAGAAAIIFATVHPQFGTTLFASDFLII